MFTDMFLFGISHEGNREIVDLNEHMNLFQGDSDQRFVTRIWLDYEKQNECE